MASVATLAVRITGDVSDVQGKLNSVAQSLDATAGRLKSAGALLTGAVSAPLLGVGGAALKAAADNEQLAVAFNTMLGSAERAAALMADLSAFAAETPFESAEVQRGAKMLLAYGVAAEDITDNMRRLGDIAAGVGVRLEDLSYLYGTTMVQGRMYTADLNQFTSRGIPMIDALAATMGVATDEVKALVEEGAVGFPQMQAAIAHLTDEGGRFSGLMEAQSTTLSGLYSTLRDNVALALVDIGDAIVEAFDLKTAAAAAIQGVETIRSAIADLSRTNPDLLRTGAVVGALAAAVGPALVGVGMGVNLLKTAMTGLAAVGGVVGALSGPVLLLIGAVAALGAAWHFNWFGMREIVDGVVAAVTERWGALQAAFAEGRTSLGGVLGEMGAVLLGVGTDTYTTTTNIRELVLALTGATGAADVVEGSLRSAGEALAGVRAAFAEAAAAVATFGQSDAWAAAVEGASASAAAVWEAMTGVFSGDVSLGEFRDKLLAELGAVGAAVGELLASDAFGALTGNLASALGLDALSADIGSQLAPVQDAFAPLFDFLEPSIARLRTALGALPDQVGALAEKLGPLREAAGELGAALAGLFGGPGAAVAGALLAGTLTAVTNAAGAAVGALAPLAGALMEQITTVLGGLAGIVNGLSTALGGISAGNAQTVVEGLTTAFGGLRDIVAGTLENSLQVVQTALGAIGDLLSTTLADWGFGAAAETVDRLVGGVTTLLEKIRAIGTGDAALDFAAPDWIVRLLDWLWPSLELPALLDTLLGWTWPGLTLPPLVERLVAWDWPAFPGLPQWVDNLMGWEWPRLDMPGWLDDLFAFEWPTFSWPSWLPGGPPQPDGAGQLGVTYARGGAYVVGEAGREIVTLPRGASVIPNRRTEEILAGGGVTVIIQNAHMGSEADSWRLAYQIDDLRRRRRG